jgi:hypothetical protein
MEMNFAIGQILEAIIMRVVNKTHFVVSISGTYYMIENQTPVALRPGNSIKLIVDSVLPLRMKLHKQTHDGHIHFHI